MIPFYTWGHYREEIILKDHIPSRWRAMCPKCSSLYFRMSKSWAFRERMEGQLFVIHWLWRPSDGNQQGEPSTASNVLLKRNRIPWSPGLPVVTHLTLASANDNKQHIIRFSAHCHKNTPFIHSTNVSGVLFQVRTSARHCTRQRLGCGPCIPALVD